MYNYSNYPKTRGIRSNFGLVRPDKFDSISNVKYTSRFYIAFCLCHSDCSCKELTIIFVFCFCVFLQFQFQKGLNHRNNDRDFHGLIEKLVYPSRIIFVDLKVSIQRKPNLNFGRAKDGTFINY